MMKTPTSVCLHFPQDSISVPRIPQINVSVLPSNINQQVQHSPHTTSNPSPPLPLRTTPSAAPFRGVKSGEARVAALQTRSSWTKHNPTLICSSRGSSFAPCDYSLLSLVLSTFFLVLFVTITVSVIFATWSFLTAFTPFSLLFSSNNVSSFTRKKTRIYLLHRDLDNLSSSHLGLPFLILIPFSLATVYRHPHSSS